MKNDIKKQHFSHHLQQLLQDHGLTKKQFCQELKVKPSTLKAWLAEEKCPRADRVKDVAAYFQITPEELLGETGEPAVKAVAEVYQPEKDLVALLRLLMELPPEQLRSVAAFAEFIHPRPADKA